MTTFARYRTPVLCKAAANNKIGIVKKLLPMGGSLCLNIPYEWLFRHKSVKEGKQVIVQINELGFLVILPYQGEATFKVKANQL